MVKVVNSVEEANCITHSGTMHADEVFATAFLDLYLKDIKVFRTPTVDNNKDYTNKLVYDIGRGKYDHHQNDALKRDNGVTYSSMGLIWKEFGKLYLNTLDIEESQVEEVFNYIDKDLIEAIDGDDNGIFPSIDCIYKVKTLSNVFKLFNPSYKSDDEETYQFLEAVKFAKVILTQEIKYAKGKIIAKYKVLNLLNNCNSNILILDEYLPYEETILTYDKELKIDFVVFPSNRGGYNIKTLHKSLEDKTNRKNFPLSWAGLEKESFEEVTGVKGAVFCHSARFIVSCKTIDVALKLIDIALKDSINIENNNIDIL